ncbi:MAG: hypothetical protein A2508_03180 [Candidatus Lambdaproteobacteria bacterium RIFOXYD12_FULL_49_8]|nr:MAG: hypothetical protein A2508_03180 [Candidatus Lambdaproteobacteria bacterium RIFOXYD12_FULL_49_8]
MLELGRSIAKKSGVCALKKGNKLVPLAITSRAGPRAPPFEEALYQTWSSFSDKFTFQFQGF